MIAAIALVDLDDTLFQTLRKCPPDVPRDRLTPLGFLRDGSPLSYATPTQMRFLDWLRATTRVVPVTARSIDALGRARIAFDAAVCAHGGVILDDDGQVDRAWQARIGAAAATEASTLDALAAAIAASASRLDPAVNVRVLGEHGIPLYVVAKHADADAAVLNRIVDDAVPALPPGWTDHRNGNNIALLPPHLGKEHAVAHLLPGLRARHPDLPVIGVGDSITDAPFMQLCDFMMTPSGSQLANTLR